MKIKSYDADQFAGVNHQKVDFTDGVNVVVGDNEAGKSTLINGIYHTLVTTYNPKKKEKSTFQSAFFPSNGATRLSTKLVLDEDGKEYIISKGWASKKPTGSLEADGQIEYDDAADAKIQELLEYGTAVYNYLIFGRQGNEEQVLAWCDRFFSEENSPDVEEARTMVTSALSAVQGIPVEKLQKALNLQINSMGKRWDFDADRPKEGRGIENPYVKDLGSILEAYYQYKRAERDYENAVRNNDALSNAQDRLNSTKQEKKEAEQLLDTLRKKHESAKKVVELEKQVQADARQKARTEDAIAHWAVYEQDAALLEGLKAQQTEVQTRKQKDTLRKKLDDVRKTKTEIKRLEESLEGLENISTDTENAEQASTKETNAQNKLRAATLHGVITLLSPHTAEVIDADGKKAAGSGRNEFSLRGFTEISIPEVGEIKITPEGIDTDALQETIRTEHAVVEDILKKYGVRDLTELKSKNKAAAESRQNLKYQRERLADQEEETSLEEQLNAVKVNETLHISETLEQDIAALLAKYRENNMDVLSGKLTQKLGGYADEYGTCEKAAKTYEDNEKQWAQRAEDLKELQSQTASFTPQEKAELEQLPAKIDDLRKDYDEGMKNIGTLEALETDLSSLAAMKENIEQLKQKWESEKTTYEEYKQILADLDALSAGLGNKYADFYQKFEKYLDILSNHHITRTGDGKLQFTSGKNANINSSLLSRGTKKTVLLAFRLAMMEYFYPNGGGFIVLDDELLDMDPGRRKKAAELLQEFGKNNQVILTTCDPAIADLVGGNRISM